MSFIEIVVSKCLLNAKFTTSSAEKLIRRVVAPDSEIIYGVLVGAGDEFIRRMRHLEIPPRFRRVKYRDLNDRLVRRKKLDAFTKDKRFRRQREFRFIFKLEETAEHVYIDIGDISDIAQIVELRISRK